jgi:hypothetical protein
MRQVFASIFTLLLAASIALGLDAQTKGLDRRLLLWQELCM